MKISQIENGLSYAGRTRARNYEERSCAPKRRGNADCCNFARLSEENRILKHALKNATYIIAAQDTFTKSSDRII